jgi:hypothetical protein
LLLQYLTYFGNAVVRAALSGRKRQTLRNLFVLLAGNTAKARKASRPAFATSTRRPIRPGARMHQRHELGRGVLHAIRDPVYTVKKGVSVMTDPGVADKRLCSTSANSTPHGHEARGQHSLASSVTPGLPAVLQP